MRRILASLLSAAAALLASAVPAVADVFGPISLVSDSPTEQVLFAHDPAISADGRYVAFDGSFDGVTGVWRRDLPTGEVEQVAGGDAELPSISEEGRFVSFTTNEGAQLVADTDGEAHTPGPQAPNVYRRDMERQPAQEGAFVLVSVAIGSGEALTYQTSEPPRYGSVAAGRTAMSANGQKIAFVTTAVSDLDGPGTPAMQVAVRDLETAQTELVSTNLEGKPVEGAGGEYGAVYESHGAPPSFGQPPSYALAAEPTGASISADGSTVTWLGQDIAEQAQLLPGEAELVPPQYTEPLWRRIEDLPASPTRRITGGSDPTDPACIASGERVLPQSPSLSDPCEGPFRTNTQPPGTWTGGPGEVVPQLSADGYKVAFLASALPLALGEDFGLIDQEERHSDLYVVDMHETREGRVLSRSEALTPLTELAGGNEVLASTNASILDFAISPDGTQVAFTTERTEFPLPSLSDVSAPAAEAGLAELFDVDLSNNTLTRVTSGFEGGSSEYPHQQVLSGIDPYGLSDGALSPSFAGDGDTLAFSSTASNLVYGDGNTPPAGSAEALGLDGGDVFVVSRVIFGSTPTPQQISSPPAGPALVPVWTLGVTSSSNRDGRVSLDVAVPGAGSVRADADSAVLVRSVRSARVARGSAQRLRAGTVVATRQVAAATKATAASAGGQVALTLTLSRAYSALASRPGGLSATVKVAFASVGHSTLHRSIAVTFLHVAKPAHRARRAAAKPRRAR